MAADATTARSSEMLENELKALIIEALKLEDTTPEDIDSDAPLVGGGLGLDSIDVLEMAMAVQRRFGVKTEADDQENQKIYSSVRSLAEFIARRRAEETTES